ncbi:MAG: hypothetical protein PHH98_05575 [Candidatus Gracilibacteria bacterium]|nr:hypothetical protein [Candidatus Gracilibacteria bacterium]
MTPNSPNEIMLDNENLEITKQINQNLKKLEQQAKANQALGMLKLIDNQIPDFDIDMTYDKTNDKFYFISGNQKLNIPLDIEKIEEIGKAITILLNNKKKLGITGKQDFRRIFEVSLFGADVDNQVYYGGTKLKGNTLDIDTATKNNNNIEELYKFTQILKGIPKNQWVIEGGIGTALEIGNN